MPRKYSDRQRAEALAMYDACGNLQQVQETLGIPDSTLSNWVNGKHGMNEDIPDLRNFKKLQLADKLEAIAHQCAGLLPERLPDANVREIVGAMAQSIEKGQLLRGDPTSISARNSKDSQLSSAKRSYVIAALPQLASNHPDWPAERLQSEAEQSFNAWFESLNLTPVITEQVQ